MRPRRVSGLTTTRRIGTAAWLNRRAGVGMCGHFGQGNRADGSPAKRGRVALNVLWLRSGGLRSDAESHIEGLRNPRHPLRRSRARLCSLDRTRVYGDIVLAARKGAASAPGPNSRRHGGGHAKKFAPVNYLAQIDRAIPAEATAGGRYGDEQMAHLDSER